MSFGTSLITNIVENLQLHIKDVHIRYEDAITFPENPFCCGLNIDALTAQSCDINWIPGFTSNWTQNDATFKLVELNSLSLYLNRVKDDQEFLSKCDSSELKERFEKIIKESSNYEYIVKPVSAQAKLKRDRSETPLRTRNRPRLTCNLIWNEISLSLNESQYKAIVNGLNGLDDIARFTRYRLLQPKLSVKGNVREWWLYAARCHGFLKHQNPITLAMNNVRYIKICKRLIANPNEALSSDDKEFKESIEKERNVDDLRELREICMYLVPHPTVAENSNQGRSMLLHWFPQWMGWYGNAGTPQSTHSTPPSSSSGTPAFEQATTFEDELLNALADTAESNSILKRDAVFGKFQFLLKKGTLNVFKENIEETKQNEAVQFHFEELTINIESRPRSGSHFLSLTLGSILVKDFLTLNTEFPDLIKPQSKDELLLKSKMQRSRLSLNVAASPPLIEDNEPLFVLEYEHKPLSYSTDYRLLIKSRSLDIVYNTEVLSWILDFLSKPHAQKARLKLEAMKHKTKMELKKNWNDMIEGRLSERKTWTFEIDISAPQILFVENFIDRQGSTIIVIDLGRLQLSNGIPKNPDRSKDLTKTVDETNLDMSIEDDDLFLTPCSTPPEFDQTIDSITQTASDDFRSPLNSLNLNSTMQDEERMNESSFYHKIYDRYEINLTDLQILVCKGKERWNFASSKGTSNLHLLDRFNIQLHLERRTIHTTDPQYPLLTLCGTLPKLNAHINESKITSIANMMNKVFNSNIESPLRESALSGIEEMGNMKDAEKQQPSDGHKLIILQFSLDQMSLEVQSFGRSIAELQVSGVKASLTQRESDTNITLSVHGLLLVDAMQSYGPDFELLVASHRHVGMDSLSGSLRQSEPCSPNSPGSPDGTINMRPTSPLSLSKAISTLQRGE